MRERIKKEGKQGGSEGGEGEKMKKSNAPEKVVKGKAVVKKSGKKGVAESSKVAKGTAVGVGGVGKSSGNSAVKKVKKGAKGGKGIAE